MEEHDQTKDQGKNAKKTVGEEVRDKTKSRKIKDDKWERKKTDKSGKQIQSRTSSNHTKHVEPEKEL